ncbi:MAG TPA: thioredoxin family protein [Candidatus Binatia bacterium]|nr:thioredoxin family protein [Candidatus Binatia bacterium]
MSFGRLRSALAASTIFALVIAGPALAGGDWNDSGIQWKSYEEGLSEAKASKKPVMLVFYTEWCPHCTNYAKLFHDPKLVELSKKFVMIRIDKDKDAATSGKYAPDGQYIPRTFFLKSDGTLLADVTEQRPQYKYFYDENDPASVMRSMNAVLAMPAQS